MITDDQVKEKIDLIHSELTSIGELINTMEEGIRETSVAKEEKQQTPETETK